MMAGEQKMRLKVPKLDVKSLSQKERQELRLRSKAIPLVVDHDPLDILVRYFRHVACKVILQRLYLTRVADRSLATFPDISRLS